MDQIRTGELIRLFRTERGLTQKQLAEQLCVSDKAVSKWECGCGCPDVSLLTVLADVLGTDVQVLLSGEIDKNESEKGNMKKMNFFVCPHCGNIITAASNASVSCCGTKLSPCQPRVAAPSEMLSVQDIGGEWLISSGHEMSKEHFISFVAYVSDSSFMLFKQYPEWGININLPMYRSGKLVWFCNKCGLLCQDIRPERK